MKTIFRFMQFVLLFSLISITLAACGGGGGSDGIPLASNSGQPTVHLSGTIGPAGGTLEVTDSQSDMFRAKIVIPPGALDSDTAISLTKVETAVAMPLDIREGGVVIDFGPDGTVFNKNVIITMPYDDVDNDGYVDYTRTLENELKVAYWNSSTKQWTNIDNIISRDTINNTITFETNHFSIMDLIVECLGSKHEPVFIYTIDGLDFIKTLIGGKDNYPARTGYLYRGMLETKVVTKCDCYAFGGDANGDSWHGDAKKTAGLIKGLKESLIEAKKYAKSHKQKFVVVSHSWGTQLGTIALGSLDEREKADLFITLSDPQGTGNVKPEEYINEFFLSDLLPKVEVLNVEALINDYVKKYGALHYDNLGLIQTTAWKNYWDVSDVISGPLKNGILEEPVEAKNNMRTWSSTWKYHAITSLCCSSKKYNEDGDSYWKEEKVVSLGEDCQLPP